MDGKKRQQAHAVFSTSTDDGKSSSQEKSIALTTDAATHPEGMPKVAFKKDGSIIDGRIVSDVECCRALKNSNTSTRRRTAAEWSPRTSAAAVPLT